MISINLANKSKSNILYKVLLFPDGQKDIIIDVSTIPLGSEILIKSHFNSFTDLEIIMCATKALNRLGYNNIHLYIPYLLGARSDRHFTEGGNSYLVDIIAPLLNAQNYKSVTVLDPHSDVAAACIKGLIENRNLLFVDWAVKQINSDNVTLISPDAGALKKIYEVAKEISYKRAILIASKHREIETGKILSTELKIPNDGYTHFLIVDDICDGGRTFIELAKKIKEQLPVSKIWLAVTHGIFSSGLKELSEYFDCIYTTNSVMNINSMRATTEFEMHNERYLDKVQQLDIFK